MPPRYHVQLGIKRTTVSLDETLADLLALQLNQQPHTPEAHTAVRAWLQRQLEADNDPYRARVSQWLQGQVILALVDKKLSDAYGDWLLGLS